MVAGGSMNFITVAEQKPRQISAVLAGNAEN